jgi:proliferating cell nuclear antigen
VGVNMLNLHKLIRTINTNDTLTLYVDSADMNHLCIKIENQDKNSRTTYKLNLLDLDHQDITVDATTFPQVISLPSTDFQKICRDMHNLADFIDIKSIHNQLIFSCKGDFCSQETIISDNEPAEGASGSEIVQGLFSLKHLVLFTKCTNLCPTVELYVRNDYPVIVRYEVSSLGSIRLALAPQ